MMNYGNYGYGPYGHSSLEEILSFILWAAIIVLVILLIRKLAHRKGACGHPGCHDHEAVDILNERYAKGEIDKKEYEEKKKDLGG